MSYRLLQIWGQVEPILFPEVAGWDGFERAVVEFLREGDFKPERDGVFFVETDAKGRLKHVSAFTQETFDELMYRAQSPKAWQSKKRK